MAKRILSALIPCSFLLITFSASAAIPVRWTVDTFRVKPLVYECYHGETLDLAAAMTAYGEPLDLHGKTAKLYWQTNGMDSAYWSTNATITTSQTSQTPQTSQTTNVLQATFVGSFDPGAPSVSGFIGVEGENYRASFTLNFRPSPGFTPAHIAPPVKVLDFATTQVANPEASPFMVKGGAGGIDAATAGTIATNTVDAKVASWAMNGQPKPSGGADTNAVNDLIRSYDTTNLTARIAAKQDKLPYATNAIPAGVIADAPWLTASATNGLRRVEDMVVYGPTTYEPWKMGDDVLSFKYENANKILWQDDIGFELWYQKGEGWCFEGGAGTAFASGTEYDLSVNFSFGTFTRKSVKKIGPTSDRLATTNGVNAAIASSLSGRTYDFDHGSNFTKRVYAALTNVIQALGGTVANPPTFN